LRGYFNKAFTLIELLVVIAVIAMLMAVLLPSLRAARMLAQRTVSASNMRQLGVAITLYANDHKGRFPLTMHTSTDRKKTWVYTLLPYVSDVDKIRICPADPKGKERLAYNTTSYLFNEYLTPMYRLGKLVAEESFISLQQLRRPQDTHTLFVAADRWSADDAGADHTHSRSWFLSTNPQDRWSAVSNDIQPDRYRSGSPAPDKTRGSTLFAFADTRVVPTDAARVKDLTALPTNFAKPKR